MRKIKFVFIDDTVKIERTTKIKYDPRLSIYRKIRVTVISRDISSEINFIYGRRNYVISAAERYRLYRHRCVYNTRESGDMRLLLKIKR